MTSTVFSSFKGIVPGTDDELLPDGYARVAHNVKLCHGRLDPWREPLKLHTLAGARSLHIRDGVFYGDTDPNTCWVDIEPCGDTIKSGPCICPVKIDGDCNETTLGLPCPHQPTVNDCDYPEDDGAFTELRTYVITYGDGMDQGAPSMVSVACKANKGDKITLTLPQPDPKYNGVTEICIYRSAATWDINKGMWSPTGETLLEGLHDITTQACYFQAGCVPVGTTEFCDDGQYCGDLLVSEHSTPPCEGLCITGMTHLGSLVGYKDGCVYFSERNTHYAWPDKYKIDIGCEVKHVCVDRNTVFVLTEGTPFVIQDFPEAIDTLCREPQPASKPAPIASDKSAVCIDGTAIYAANNGLVALAPDATVTEIGLNEWCRDNWRQINPCTMVAACYDGDYFFSTDCFSGVYSNLLNAREPVLSTIGLCPECWTTGKDGELYLLDDGEVLQWDAGANAMRLEYQTASRRIPVCNTVARLVHAGKRRECIPCDTLFEYIGDDCLIFQRQVRHSELFNICRSATESFSVKVTGYRSIKRIELGPNRECLSQ